MSAWLRARKPARSLRSPLDDWNRMIDINLRGVLHGIAAALPIFRTQGSGQFSTVAPTAAYKWVPGQAVYAAHCESTRHQSRARVIQ
ncbi:MAG: SDR family NAD(P)-dependent oxidoreductase [Trebonia sp.]